MAVGRNAADCHGENFAGFCFNSNREGQWFALGVFEADYLVELNIGLELDGSSINGKVMGCASSEENDPSGNRLSVHAQ